ncbi:VRR-NUC domain-containing protein [Brucella intermedia]|nr:VRR-NUC domain-containing protein [Brucella intermedia]MCB4919682.1 VRR-NUC domain-containing protein [Brucella intermedia]
MTTRKNKVGTSVSTQTVRINGARVKITTKAGKVTTKPALPLEWELQAAQVSALRRLPQYQREFLLAGDMNASKRGPRAQAQAIATGMTSGEPDLRIYGEYGRLLMIENKVGQGRLSPAQKDRHAALRRLGYTVMVIRAITTTEAAEKAVTAVLGWLAQEKGKAA